MIPLGDEGTPRPRGLPIVNITIIALNIGMFFLQLTNDAITYGWSLIPKEITTGQDIIGVITVPGTTEQIQLYAAPLGIPYLTLLTSMFLHGGWLHIAGNMLFLFIFGDNVEDNFGPIKYLIFYLVCGFAADFTQIFFGGKDSVIPNLGASGAIAGVLGAYLVLFPQARIRTLIPLGIYATITYVPAIIMIGVWIITQVVSALLTPASQGGVAFFAHIGGAVAGLLLVFVFRSKDTGTTYPVFNR